MTASIPALPLSTEGLESFAGFSGNAPIKQIDASSSQAFGALFEQAISGVDAPAVAGQNAVQDAQRLLQQLRTLPQGGKLLPLVEAYLDVAVASGADAGHVLEQLAASVETLEADVGLDPQQAITVALFQAMNANPEYVAATASGVSSNMQKLTELLHQQVSPDAARSAENLPADRAPQDAKTAGTDKVSGFVQQAPPAPLQPQPDVMAALAAFRRLTTAGGSAGPEPTSRIDGLTALVPTQQAVVSATSTASALPSVAVDPPVGQPNWDQALSERVQWLVGQGAQRAQIRLNPAHLGPVEVRIQVQNDQANVQFTSAHAVVRDAVEAALPRLREMLGASGVELVNVDISSGQSFAERQGGRDGDMTGSWPGSGVQAGESPETLLETPVAALLQSGRLDLFV